MMQAPIDAVPDITSNQVQVNTTTARDDSFMLKILKNLRTKF